MLLQQAVPVSSQALANLWLTLLQGVGTETDSFEESTGALSTLTACGESIDRIDYPLKASISEIRDVAGVELSHSVASQRHGEHKVIWSPPRKSRR
ncbi:MAG: hypothetical protein ACKOHG_18070 [Planctomycetia bacterium]